MEPPRRRRPLLQFQSENESGLHDLFEDTFSMTLMPLGVLAALELEETGLVATERERVERLDPCVFVDSDAAAPRHDGGLNTWTYLPE